MLETAEKSRLGGLAKNLQIVSDGMRKLERGYEKLERSHENWEQRQEASSQIQQKLYGLGHTCRPADLLVP